MLRFGKITAIKAEAGQFQVTFDEDQLVSGWLFGASRNTKDNKDECPFDMDEHVACLMDENCEHGVVMFAIYDKKNPPPVGNPDIRVTTFKDGTFIQYDRANHKLTVSCEGDVEVVKATNLKITADLVAFNDGENHGLVKVVELKGKLNALENKVNAIIAAYNAHIHITTATIGASAVVGVLSATVSQVTGTLTPTQQADIENPDVKH